MALSKPCVPALRRASVARRAAFALPYPNCKVADLNLDGLWCKDEEKREKKCSVIVLVSKEADVICVEEAHVGKLQRQAVRDFAAANNLIPFFALCEKEDPALERWQHLRAHDHEKYSTSSGKDANRAGSIIFVTKKFAGQWRIQHEVIEEGYQQQLSFYRRRKDKKRTLRRGSVRHSGRATATSALSASQQIGSRCRCLALSCARMCPTSCAGT